jgi:hypothetical protein
MKIHILRVLVLLVSISAASVLIWNASRHQKPHETQEGSTFDPDDMQVSPKSGPMLSSDDIKTLDNDPLVNYGTKIEGIPVDISEVTNFIPSSKSIDAILKAKDVEGIIEGRKTENKQEPPLMSSSKSSLPIFEPKDLEKIIEPEKRDPNAKQELPPQQDPFAPKEKNEK